MAKEEYFDDNNQLTEEGIKWMDKLNEYSKKCQRINQATCWEDDKEVAEGIKNIGKNTDEMEK